MFPIVILQKQFKKHLPDLKQMPRNIQKTKTMDMPLLTWLLIVGILILAVITRTIIFLHTSRRERFHFRPFEIGSEREEFFVPGDPRGSDEDID